MIVITVARKPLGAGNVAANVLAHGCGALNIDASRIAPVDGEHVGPGGWADPNNRIGPVGSGNFVTQRDVSKMAEAQAASVERANRMGRWPANLVLGHRDGCQQEGTKRVKVVDATAHAAHHSSRSHDSVGTQAHVHPSFRDSEGKETVAAWHCVDGCPVAALDVQSGVLHARGNTTPTTQGGGLYGLKIAAKDAGPMDGGGASRFFKQVGRR